MQLRRETWLRPLESRPWWQTGLISIVLFWCFAVAVTPAQRQRPHVFRPASLEKAKALIETFRPLPRLTGLKADYFLDLTSVENVEAMGVDAEDMVVLVYTWPPPVHISLRYTDGSTQRELNVQPNGFFFSTVDLASISSKISRYTPGGLEPAQYVPKGKYVWLLAQEGVVLSPSHLAGPSWVIHYDKPLSQPIPESVLYLAKMRVLADGRGFQIGPADEIVWPPNKLATDSIAFTVSLTVYQQP